MERCVQKTKAAPQRRLRKIGDKWNHFSASRDCCDKIATFRPLADTLLPRRQTWRTSKQTRVVNASKQGGC